MIKKMIKTNKKLAKIQQIVLKNLFYQKSLYIILLTKGENYGIF